MPNEFDKKNIKQINEVLSLEQPIKTKTTSILTDTLQVGLSWLDTPVMNPMTLGI